MSDLAIASSLMAPKEVVLCWHDLHCSDRCTDVFDLHRYDDEGVPMYRVRTRTGDSYYYSLEQHILPFIGTQERAYSIRELEVD